MAGNRNLMAGRRARRLLVFFVLFLAAFFLFALNVGIGSVSIPIPEIARILLRRSSGGTASDILWSIRLPRAIMAAVLGGALAVSGYLLQTYFSNPIAGPYILGISSGAKLMVALYLIHAVGHTRQSSSVLMIAAALAGALITTAWILLISRKIRSMAALLIAGVMVGYINSAVTDLVVTFAEDAEIVRLHGWTQGSFSGMSWENVRAAVILIALTMAGAVFLLKPMAAYRLGENYARSMGVNVRRFRVLLILTSSILSASVTAYAGPVSFVGIAVPYLMRRFLASTEPAAVLPACFLGGGVFCLFCDLIARCAFAPTELSISTVTACFGAPVVIAMMIRRSGKGGRNA